MASPEASPDAVVSGTAVKHEQVNVTVCTGFKNMLLFPVHI